MTRVAARARETGRKSPRRKMQLKSGGGGEMKEIKFSQSFQPKKLKIFMSVFN